LGTSAQPEALPAQHLFNMLNNIWDSKWADKICTCIAQISSGLAMFVWVL